MAQILEVAVGTEDENYRALLLLSAAHSHAMRAILRPYGEAGESARADMNRFLTGEQQESVKQV